MSNKIIVLAGVSGVGKTTIAELLKNKYSFKSPASYTTRARRPNEVDGEHYYFISKEQFQSYIQQDFFLEYDQVFGNYYGTSRQQLESILQDSNIVLVLTTSGYQIFKNILGNKIIGFYLMPPDKKELLLRVADRNSSAQEIQNRLKDIFDKSKKDSTIFDYVLEPSDTDFTLSKILKILNITPC